MKTFIKLNDLAKYSNQVIVLSYGYDEISCFGSHYEPFGNKRKFSFAIEEDRWGITLRHPWLFFRDEQQEIFYIEDGVLYCDDPELMARATCD